MSGSSQLISQLTKKLLDELGSKTRSGTLKGRVPDKIKKRVDSYNMFRHLWAAADHDILVIVAMADVMWDEAIQPIKNDDEEKLQIRFGVNAFSEAATEGALRAMRTEREALRTLKLTCEALRPLAKALAARALLGGPANASQIQFDRLGAEQAEKLCKKNEAALTKVLARFETIIKINQDVLDAHRSH